MTSNPDALKPLADRVSISEVNSRNNEEMSLSTEEYEYVHKVTSATQYNAAQEEMTAVIIGDNGTASTEPHNESIKPASNNLTEKKTISIAGTPDFLLPGSHTITFRTYPVLVHLYCIIRESFLYKPHQGCSMLAGSIDCNAYQLKI